MRDLVGCHTGYPFLNSRESVSHAPKATALSADIGFFPRVSLLFANTLSNPTWRWRVTGAWVVSGKSSWGVDWDPSGIGNKPRAHHCILTMLGGTFKLQPPISYRIGGCLLLLIIMMCCCCLLLLLSLLWTVSTCPATTFKNHADETLRSVSCAGRFLGIIYGSNSECFQVQHVVIFWFFFFLLLECIPYISSSQLSVSWSLQCPSNTMWPFTIGLSQNKPFQKCNPKLKMKMSLEVLDIICASQEPTSVGHCH